MGDKLELSGQAFFAYRSPILTVVPSPKPGSLNSNPQRDCSISKPLSTWRSGGLSKSVIRRVIVGVVPFRVT